MKSTLSMPVCERPTMRLRGTRGLLPTRPATAASFRSTYARNAAGAVVSAAVTAHDAVVAVPATAGAPAAKPLATANAPVRRSALGSPPR